MYILFKSLRHSAGFVPGMKCHNEAGDICPYTHGGVAFNVDLYSKECASAALYLRFNLPVFIGICKTATLLAARKWHNTFLQNYGELLRITG